MAEQETIRVACRVPGGMKICKWKPGFDDGTGVKTTIRDGEVLQLRGPVYNGGTLDRDGVGLTPGETEVPADWRFDEWLSANHQNPYVAEGLIFIVKDEDDRQ